MRRLKDLGACCALVLATSCVGGSSESSDKDKEALKEYILDKAPDDVGTKIDADFDGKVTLLGAKVEPAGPVKVGDRVTVTMFWRSDKKLDEGWNLFTHVLDGAGAKAQNIDNVGPLREWRETHQALSPSAWEPGKVYKDVQTFNVPPEVKTQKMTLVTGIWRESDRIKIVKGPKDGDNRATVATIQLTGAPPEAPKTNPRLPMLRVDRLEKGAKIKLDGKLDEPEWATSPITGPFVDVATGMPNTTFRVNGSAHVLWSDEGLYLGFEVKDPDVIGGFKKGDKDPHLWTKDCVEIMVDPDGDGDNKDYYEIQVNPQGLVFDSQFDDYNQPKKEPDGPFGHQDWSSNLKVGVSVDGTLDKADDQDKGYVVELMIPWKAFGKAKQSPPKPGDTWRINLYAVENNNAVAWSGILKQGNFHKATRFGRVLFGEKGWMPAAAGSASAAASAAPPGSAPAAPSALPPGMVRPLDTRTLHLAPKPVVTGQ